MKPPSAKNPSNHTAGGGRRGERTQERLQELTPAEREVVETVARVTNRTVDDLTLQEINYMLTQAHEL
jgi:hypothetical protein